jgi:hypothetical protein
VQRETALLPNSWPVDDEDGQQSKAKQKTIKNKDRTNKIIKNKKGGATTKNRGTRNNYCMVGWKFSLLLLCLALIVPQVIAVESQAASSAKSADFIVINQNILEVPVEKIHKTKVLQTVLQGKTVYQK